MSSWHGRPQDRSHCLWLQQRGPVPPFGAPSVPALPGQHCCIAVAVPRILAAQSLGNGVDRLRGERRRAVRRRLHGHPLPIIHVCSRHVKHTELSLKLREPARVGQVRRPVSRECRSANCCPRQCSRFCGTRPRRPQPVGSATSWAVSSIRGRTATLHPRTRFRCMVPKCRQAAANWPIQAKRRRPRRNGSHGAPHRCPRASWLRSRCGLRLATRPAHARDSPKMHPCSQTVRKCRQSSHISSVTAPCPNKSGTSLRNRRWRTMFWHLVHS